MAIYMWREYQIPDDALYFSAKQANSRIRIEKNGSPSSVSLETSTDGVNWLDYTISTTINLVNV
jgi:hypothetical protein